MDGRKEWVYSIFEIFYVNHQSIGIVDQNNRTNCFDGSIVPGHTGKKPGWYN